MKANFSDVEFGTVLPTGQVGKTSGGEVALMLDELKSTVIYFNRRGIWDEVHPDDPPEL